MDPIFSYEAKESFFAGCISPTNNVWVGGTIEGNIFLFHKDVPNPTSICYSSNSIRAIEFDEIGATFLSGDKSGTLYLTDTNTLQNSLTIKNAHHSSIECLKFLTPHTVVVGDTSGFIKLWDLRTEKAEQTARPDQDYLSDIVAINDQNYVTVNGIGSCSVWTTHSNKRKQYYVQEDDDFTTVTYSTFLNYIIIGSSRPKLYVTQYSSLDFVCESPGNTKSAIVAVRYLTNTQNRVIVAQDDGTCYLTEISPNRPVVAFQAHQHDIIGATLRGTQFMTWGNDKTIKIWDLEELSTMERKKASKGKKKKTKVTNVSILKKKDDFFTDY